MLLDEIRTRYKQKMLAIAGEHYADSLRVFGSVARGEETADSDVDILVRLHKGASLMDLVAMDIAFSDLLNRKVEVVPDDALKPEYAPYILKDAVAL